MGVLGDVIGAHALMEAARQRGSLPLPVLTALLDRPPRKENFAPGSRLRMVMGDRVADLAGCGKSRDFEKNGHGTGSIPK